MKEVKNILPNSVLVNLYKESLVLGAVPENVDKKEVPSPVIEPENAIITAENDPIAPIKFLGEHQKKILVLVQDSSAVHLNERDFDLLTSILNACKLTIADIALINLSNKNFSLHQILEQAPSDFVLIFDINPTQLKIKLPTKLYSPILLGATQLLFCNNLSNMQGIDQDSKVEKMKLWNALKLIFKL
ncbi:MAG: hypothetical protein KA534_02950 [Sediminibacterium sp.]|jgi:hypothetical protein|nr:hypothetical protein [Sediminibacterium sp.]MBP6056769.1 hypothetical protein [Candidatus Fonsibacter sp.]MBP6144676.1 hypothetical protein [Sediminibacterium sp.]